MSVGFAPEHPSIVPPSYAASRPEERPKTVETNASASSTAVHSTCFSHKDPYMFSPPSDNPVWVSNQKMTLSDDDTPLKIGNPITVPVARPTGVFGNECTSSSLAHTSDSRQDGVPANVICCLRNYESYTSISLGPMSDPFHVRRFGTDTGGNNPSGTRGKIYTEECMEWFPGNSPN
jgi:hypothetical protein